MAISDGFMGSGPVYEVISISLLTDSVRDCHGRWRSLAMTLLGFLPIYILRLLKWTLRAYWIHSLEMSKQYFIYIMTNRTNTVLYTGVTNDLKRRVYELREKLVDGFTRQYNIKKLVYYEMTESIESAILREKQIKDGSRNGKKKLISDFNPRWDDLYVIF